MALTEKAIRDLKPGSKTAFVWDDRIAGKGRLGVRVTAAGAKAYVLDYFDAGGTRRRMSLGRPGEMSLAQARDRASRELATVRDGKPDMAARRRQAVEAPTVADLIDQFLAVEGPARIERGRMTERTLTEYRRQSARYIVPAIGKLRIADVKRGDIEKMVAPLPGPTGNRVLALASRLFSLAERWQWRIQNDNPARGIERSREEARDRTLSSEEFSALARALDERAEKYPAAVDAIRVAATTGLRISEVLSIRWADVDFQTGRLRLPTTKTGARSHDLPSAALAILVERPRIHGNPFCFTSGRNAPVGYWHARSVFAECARAAGLSDVRLHDLRRSLMTRAAMAGVGTHVLRDLLGHKSTVMADRYIREVGGSVREARETMGAEIASMMEGKSGEIVPLRERRRG